MSGTTSAAVRGRPWLGACLGLLLSVLAVATAAPAAAATCEEECGSSQEADDDATSEERSSMADGAAESAPALALEVVPVVGDGPDDGDLTRDDETGLATLTFSASTPVEQTAVYAYTATNTGTVPLHDLEVVDDHLGTVLAAAAGTSLAPGEATTVRASAVFTFAEVAGGLGGLLTSNATTTATDDEGTEVTGQDDAVVQLVAVLAAPQVELQLDVVVDEGDVVAGDDGVPQLVWPAEAVAAGEARTVRYRVTVTNTGPVALQAIEVALDVLATAVVPADEGRTLEPGASFTVEVDRQVVPDDMPEAVVNATGDAEGDLPAIASLHATDSTGTQAVTATDDAVVHVVLVGTDVRGEVLPAAGPRDEAGLLAPALLLLWMGVALLGVGQPRRARSVR